MTYSLFCFVLLGLSDHHLDIKEKFCKDMLDLIEKLGVGQCKMKGLLMYELYCCKRERSARQLNGCQESVSVS